MSTAPCPVPRLRGKWVSGNFILFSIRRENQVTIASPLGLKLLRVFSRQVWPGALQEEDVGHPRQRRDGVISGAPTAHTGLYTLRSWHTHHHVCCEHPTWGPSLPLPLSAWQGRGQLHLLRRLPQQTWARLILHARHTLLPSCISTVATSRSERRPSVTIHPQSSD